MQIGKMQPMPEPMQPAASTGAAIAPSASQQDPPAVAPRKVRADQWLLPIAPIVLALITALVVHSFSPAPVPNESLGTLGSLAPDFSLPDIKQPEGAAPVALSKLVEHGPVIIIFHRGLYCPVCMSHLTDLADHIAEFKEAGIQIVAIGPDVPQTARIDMAIFSVLPFPLLADTSENVARLFGLEKPDGVVLDGAFVIDTQRRIQLAEKSGEPVGEVDELLAAGKAAAKPH